MRKQRKTKNEPTFDERIRQYISDDSVSLKEYELERTLCVNFPKRRRAVFVLNCFGNFEVARRYFRYAVF